MERLTAERLVSERHTTAPAEETLWNCIVMFQGYTFHTVSGLLFTYSLKIGRGGELTKELFIDRRENSKRVLPEK